MKKTLINSGQPDAMMHYPTLEHDEGSQSSLKSLQTKGLTLNDIDASLVVTMEMLPYLPIDKSNFRYRKEYIQCIDEDLSILLKLPHKQFWCQMVYDESVHEFIGSYYRYCPISFDALDKDLVSSRFADIERSLHRKVFLVTLRLSTHKETPQHTLSPHAFSTLIYDNWLFDIPRLYDICAIYAAANKDLVTKMIENIFKQQPKFFTDLEEFLPVIDDSLLKIRDVCRTLGHSTGMEDPLYIHIKTFEGQALYHQLEAEGKQKAGQSQKALDQLEFLEGVAHGIDTFLQCVPSAGRLYQLFRVPNDFVNTYNIAIVTLYKLGGPKLRPEWRKTRKAALGALHTLLMACYVDPLRTATSDSLAELCSEYSQLVKTMMGMPALFKDYIKAYPLAQEFLAIASQHPQTMDTSLANQLMERVEIATRPKHIPQLAPSPCSQPCLSSAVKSKPSSGSTPLFKMPTDPDELVVLESQVMSIRDIYPIGTGFAVLCLVEFGYNVERVINALLEDQLPANLQKVDRELDMSQLSSSSGLSAQPDAKVPWRVFDTMETGSESNVAVDDEVLTQRHNIYDGDEFDVFSRGALDRSRTYVGKMNKTAGMGKLDSELTDKTKKMVERQDEEERERELAEELERKRQAMLYEDEYDDTYDSHNIGANDVDTATADELTDILNTNINHVLPWALLKAKRSGSNNDEEDDDRSRDNDKVNKGPVKQADRNTPGTGRGGSTGTNSGRGRGAGGAGRGRGGKVHATPEELRERAYRDKNKSRFANHNRKAMADKKMSKGMGP